MEILNWLDDHARYAISVTAHRRVTGPIVVSTFRKACATHGIPASTLTDNGMVFTTRFAGGKGGRNHLENDLRRLGVTQINSTPGHPTICGKVERFHQTPQEMAHRSTPRCQHRRTTDPTRHLRRALQPSPPPPRTTAPRHASHRLHRPPQSHPRPMHRHPRPSPHRPRRPIRETHPAPRRPTPPHRHRPNPRWHPRPRTRARSRHPDHQRRHRRTHPPANTGPHQRLPTPRRPLRTPKKKPEP